MTKVKLVPLSSEVLPFTSLMKLNDLSMMLSVSSPQLLKTPKSSTEVAMQKFKCLSLLTNSQVQSKENKYFIFQKTTAYPSHFFSTTKTGSRYRSLRSSSKTTTHDHRRQRWLWCSWISPSFESWNRRRKNLRRSRHDEWWSWWYGSQWCHSIHILLYSFLTHVLKHVYSYHHRNV